MQCPGTAYPSKGFAGLGFAFAVTVLVEQKHLIAFRPMLP